MDFKPFPKIPRLNSTDWVLTEKLDGTNAQIYIAEATGQTVEPYDFPVVTDHSEDNPTVHLVRAGSRTRWLTPGSDNFGFAKWVEANAAELVKLGEGQHFGEWYGAGINRGYGLSDKRFALFNTHRWGNPEARPSCCEVVTELTTVKGLELNSAVWGWLEELREYGSVHVHGFNRPEGIVIYHRASNQMFKVLCENDDVPKALTKADVALAA